MKQSTYAYLTNFSDYSSGFGGRYGVQKDRQDKVSLFSNIYFFELCI